MTSMRTLSLSRRIVTDLCLTRSHPIAKLLKEDRRYKLDAYVFVFEA